MHLPERDKACSLSTSVSFPRGGGNLKRGKPQLAKCFSQKANGEDRMHYTKAKHRAEIKTRKEKGSWEYECNKGDA